MSLLPYETGFSKTNCSRCHGRGHVWRYGKHSMRAVPCPRCSGSGCEPEKKARKKR